ncbi:hypothetical protein AOL_s00075g126 [Orbilia oligospora ATCC 24927]|uniref:VOC domain-containing protein n=1 Tax=Arthrobotrys oligospora (strain ATCC 24927 / CBS 115.81 / DSM 1491) TaxID=756982 RepID=G1X8C7_ARTOA|nr:hypothetical protein AOL_s00075g126 [Orbilia oligospora ATCC 24927]EGX50700.1 hypothetical protein AOL_s00075g126 [Orbilia oligospora ATCC 24927]
MSEKRSTDVTEPTPNVDSPLKKKVKTDDIVDITTADDDDDVDTNGAEAITAAATTDSVAPEADVDTMVVEGKDTNGTEKAKTDSTADDAAAKWTPPPVGSVCWIQIPATDVGRSKAFYTSAFSFSFKPTPAGYNEEDIAMFILPNPGGSLTGGICKVDSNSTPSGSTILYFMVEDVDKALEKIVELGGKVREEKKPEGQHGLVGLFEDTEGNVHGVYQMKPAAPAADEAAE